METNDQVGLFPSVHQMDAVAGVKAQGRHSGVGARAFLQSFVQPFADCWVRDRHPAEFTIAVEVVSWRCLRISLHTECVGGVQRHHLVNLRFLQGGIGNRGDIIGVGHPEQMACLPARQNDHQQPAPQQPSLGEALFCGKGGDGVFLWAHGLK